MPIAKGKQPKGLQAQKNRMSRHVRFLRVFLCDVGFFRTIRRGESSKFSLRCKARARVGCYAIRAVLVSQKMGIRGEEAVNEYKN